MPPIVSRIVEAVADARGESPESLDPLGSYVDVEALERLLESTSLPATVTIEFEGCTVVIDEAGNVTASTDTVP